MKEDTERTGRVWK